MQVVTMYAVAHSTLGVVRDYANAQGQNPPTFTIGSPVLLKLRLFEDYNESVPYPIANLSSVVSWQAVFDRDFAKATTPPLVADHANITCQSVTETINGSEYTFTEVGIPIPDMNTQELATLLGNAEEFYGLHMELVGFDSNADETFVLQIKNFTIRNRIYFNAEPTEQIPDFLTASQARALVAAGFVLQYSTDGSTNWHDTQAAGDVYFRLRSASDSSAAWSSGIKLPAGADGTSSYTYVAYASTATGTGFSLTPSNTLKYRAEIHTTTAITTPVASDFANATWVKYLGDDGNGVDSATATTLSPGSQATASLSNGVLSLGIPKGDTGVSSYTYVAWASDSSGTDFSLTPSNTRKYRAEIHPTAPIASPVASDFAGKWVKALGDDGDNAFTVDDALSTSSENAVQNKVIKAKLDTMDSAIAQNTSAIATKQSTLSFDATPTSGSINPATSGGIYTALQEKISAPESGTAGQYLKKTANGVAWDTPAGGGGSFNPAVSDEVVGVVGSEQELLTLWENNTAIRGKTKFYVGKTSNLADASDIRLGHLYAVIFASAASTTQTFTWPEWVWYEGSWETRTVRAISSYTSDNAVMNGYYEYDAAKGYWINTKKTYAIITTNSTSAFDGTYIVPIGYADAANGSTDPVTDFIDPMASAGSIYVGPLSELPWTEETYHSYNWDGHYGIYWRSVRTTTQYIKVLWIDITPCVVGTCPFVDPTDTITALQSRIAALEAFHFGTLTVNHTGTAPTGAKWSVDSGTTWRDFGTSVTLAPGSYTVTFKSVTGYTAPSSQSVTITAGGTQTVSVAYTAVATTGTVTLTFSGTAPTGAGWAIDGNSYASGQTATLDPGTYAITYASVTGYDSPSTPTSVTVAAGDTLTLSAEYTEQSQGGGGFVSSGSSDYAYLNGTWAPTQATTTYGGNTYPVYQNDSYYLAIRSNGRPRINSSPDGSSTYGWEPPGTYVTGSAMTAASLSGQWYYGSDDANETLTFVDA